MAWATKEPVQRTTGRSEKRPGLTGEPAGSGRRVAQQTRSTRRREALTAQNRYSWPDSVRPADNPLRKAAGVDAQ
jgi:hypothetical protein